jgi:hypothetical protein
LDDPLESQDHFSVFPNPVQDILIIQSDLADEAVLLISNINGQELIRTTVDDPSTTIDVGWLDPGIYMVKLR